jgi:2-polyprenyl-6-methoxyphenol hydroxylase-like FAD-dependent oxidoreductase
MSPLPLPQLTDVLVVGGGPAGLSLGAELKRQGVSVLIIDQQLAGENTSRAAVIHARTLEVLEPLGATAELIARGLKVEVFRVRDRDKVLLTIPFDGLATAFPFTLMCPQNQTEAVLIDRLRAFGGEVVRPARLLSAQSAESGVEAIVDYAGEHKTVVARWIVGCDGAHSIVREQAGITFDGATYPQDFVLADVRMDWSLARTEVNLFFSPEGLVVVAPLPGGDFRVVATVDTAPEHPSVADVQALLDSRGPKAEIARITEVIWSSRFRVHHRVAQSPRKGAYVLCGDAAHVHSPAGGQGMNTGIQDAISLAGELQAALRSGDAAGLDRWAATRHDIAEKVVGLTDRMTRAATMHPGLGRSLRNVALAFVGHIPSAREAIARRLAELDNR